MSDFKCHILSQVLEKLAYLKPARIKDSDAIAKMHHLSSLKLSIDREQFKNIVCIDFIHTKEQGKGYGSEIMTDLCRWADEHKKILCLTPEPEWESTQEQLDKFYSKFGFVEDTEDIAWAKLIRKPLKK